LPLILAQLDLPYQNIFLSPNSDEKSESLYVNNGNIMSIPSTPMITLLVVVSDKALPNLDGSISLFKAAY